jgi:subtilisin
MGRKPYILHIFLSMIIYFTLLGSALGGERSVIIKFHQRPGHSEEALIHGARGKIKRTYRMMSAMAATLPEQEIANIAKNPRVAYIEEDSIVMAVEPLPSDEYVDSWGVAHIGCEAVHDSGIKGAGVKIAVLDTGIDYNHEDLDDNFKGGDNFVEYVPPLPDFHDPFDDSWNSHGTNVAGIIAAEQNGTGVVGVAPEAELYAVKVLDGMGGGYVSWVIAGIEWAVANNMNIINMSLSIEEEGVSQAFEDACNAAEEAGILLVAAAGNNIYGETAVTPPAAYSSVIAVSATDQEDQLGYFSLSGPEVELAAPGVLIFSTSRDNTYEVLSGTSQAAPHVAGVAALIMSAGVDDVDGDGDTDNRDVRLMLQNTAKDLGDPGQDPIYGYGLVNAAGVASTDVTGFWITKVGRRPWAGAETVDLPTGEYKITITNDSLRAVKCKVYKNGVLARRLSRTFRFGGHKPQEVHWHLNARNKALEVVFVPEGRVGGTAHVSIVGGL